MKLSSADIDFIGYRHTAKWSRFLPPPKHAQRNDLASRAVHSAINTRAGLRMFGQWGNTLALLALVRSNLARPYRAPPLPGEPVYNNLREYMQTHMKDETRRPYYRRILRRMP